MNQSEIYTKVADKLGYDEKLVKFVINHVFNNIRENIINPKSWKLMVNNFGIFYPNEKKIKVVLQREEDNIKQTRIRQEKIEEYKRILQLKQNK